MFDQTQRKTPAARNRPLYPPPPPSVGNHRSQSLLGYWVPLITIGTIAVGGLAAWIWSERTEDDEDGYPDEKPQQPPYFNPPQPGTAPGTSVPLQEQAPPPPVGADVSGITYGGGESSSYYNTSSNTARHADVEERNDQSFLGRVMRRTPSPQQFFDTASRQVIGGMAAAGKALGSIIEVDSRDHSEERRRVEEREGFSDHERWSEEAEERHRIHTVGGDSGVSARHGSEKDKGKPRRMIAIVVNADVEDRSSAHADAFHTEHGSILSHIPEVFEPEKTDLFVLVYAPTLKSLPPADSHRTSSGLGSSYSSISTPAQTPGSELQSISPRIEPSNPTWEALQQQAQALVDHPTKIMPFSTPTGFVSILRHLAPQIVYMSDTLAGREGETVPQLKGWVGHTVVVVGDEGHGGLADTETETEDERYQEKKTARRWWERSSIVGLGKEVDVVDAARVGDDWARRVNGRQ